MDVDRERRFGLGLDGKPAVPDRAHLRRHILLKLTAMGQTLPENAAATLDRELLDIGRDLFARYREQSRLLSEHLSPADRRIQDFLDRYLAPLGSTGKVMLTSETFILDRWGIARELSFPPADDLYRNEYVASHRTQNGVMHNPTSDRRTTQGVFHVAEGGLPVPGDKIAVPLVTYAHILRAALAPPRALQRLPFTAPWDAPVETMVSLLLRPLVCPEVPGFSPEKRMEVRFFAPGGLVCNLDFVESIFGNHGDPFLPENDAGLDVDHFTGHSGCVILAPHVTGLRKKDAGLPHVDAATAAQKASGMCWSRDDELYNEGRPFKLTARDASGVMVTVLGDNYFGYCKKEIKTQISFSANLFGLAEEEHAGGALAFSTYSLGEQFIPDVRVVGSHTFAETVALLGDTITIHDDGHATDRAFSTIHHIPENIEMDLASQDIKWSRDGHEQHLRLLPGHIYLLPGGYKVRMEKHPAAPSWRLVGTAAEGTFCHKPCTVSGGGKSEISKSLFDAVLYGPIYVNDFERDMRSIEGIFQHDYAGRFLPGRDPMKHSKEGGSRAILSPARSLGSVIKLLTPSEQDFTPAYNAWLRDIPDHVRSMVFIIKRIYSPGWDGDWRKHFSVDIINGAPGHELKYNGRRLVGTYLRVGTDHGEAWRTFKLRQDFVPADKVQMEDDISASVVVPRTRVPGLPKAYDAHASVKLSENCEWRLFQRPDDAIDPGVDKQTEADMAGAGLFVSNFQPLDPGDVREIVENVTVFDAFTPPMRGLLERSLATQAPYTLCSARPRLVDGKPSKNPRYLQIRPDLTAARDRRVAETGARLARRIPALDPVVFPVGAVLSGRRNNPPDGAIRPLCVYGPIHYQELPELFMDYICSVTGRSPSTTGAGSEGALTKGPFNALCATADLNNLLVSMLLTGYSGFSTAAGFIGPRTRFDHDISLLVPELWCRLSAEERDPVRMIARGQLEKIADYDFEGRTVPASRLGFRITRAFVGAFLGRVFDSPLSVFTDEILQPERQDPRVFADGVDNIVQAQQRSARQYFDDGSIEDACPPIAALLHIMAHGHFGGRDVHHPEVRALFTRESLLASAWYRHRLSVKQQRDIALQQRHVRALSDFLAKPSHRDESARLSIAERLRQAQAELSRVSGPGYLDELHGTIGADPIHPAAPGA